MIKSVLLFVFSVLNLATHAQKDAKFSEEMKKEMMEKVKAAARHAWKGYKDYAWGADDLRPLTKTSRNWYKESMLMTPVDAFDTFTILGLKTEAGEAKSLILSKLNFNVDNDVQVFEVTIRLLAGLITAYEIDGDPKFLALARDLADRLMPAFNSPTGMPYRYVHLQTGKTRDGINNPAEIGTLMLEFGQLSKITGDEKYYRAAKKGMMAVYEQRSSIGLVGEQIDIKTAKWVSTQSHISGYIDSYYEYLYKSWLLFGDRDFKRAFDVHNNALKKYLISKTDHGWFMRHVDMETGKETATLYGALDAFYAGLCAFAGDVESGRQIQEANYYMWTRFNIEPEEFNFATDSVTSASYVLRPENLESCFYLYRMTGELKYLWQGKVMVESILDHCRSDAGFASLRSVKTFEQSNSMESFFFGETLKYAYLIFAPESALDLKKLVLTTEAHPFRIRK
ncbi:MAG: glycoside hydrolase family 47 protein [Chitinophagaceae bacterium]|nr:glycoside hydrolase family 47 protein [Chitinophagaceae bacterium]